MPRFPPLTAALLLCIMGLRAETPDSEYIRLQEQSGLSAMFRQAAELYVFYAEAVEQTHPAPDGYAAAYSKAAREVFDPATMQAAMTGELKKSLQPGDLEALDAMMKTPLYDRAKAMEIKTFTIEGAKAFSAFQANPEPPSPERKAHIVRGLVDKEAVQSKVDNQLADMETSHREATPDLAPDERIGQWLEYRKTIRPSLVKQTQDYMMAWNAHTYAALSDEELGRLADAYSSPPCRRLSQALRRVQSTLDRAWMRRGRELLKQDTP